MLLIDKTTHLFILIKLLFVLIFLISTPKKMAGVGYDFEL